MDLNFDFLKYKIWEYLGLIVVYTKKRGGACIIVTIAVKSDD